MRHNNNVAKVSLKVGPRKALFRGLATSLVLKGKIKTTLARARAIRPIVEKHITLSKQNTLTTRRQLVKYYYSEKAINKLLKELGPKYQDRKGGYTRLIKLENRRGDNAPMALVELV